MKWFGPGPWAEFCDEEPKAPTPVGEPCDYCEEAIADDELGVILPFVTSAGEGLEKPMHRECFLRMVLGGARHQMRLCACYGHDEPDVDHRSRRQEAQAAVELAYAQGWRFAIGQAFTPSTDPRTLN